jgi:hypothetical protein
MGASVFDELTSKITSEGSRQTATHRKKVAIPPILYCECDDGLGQGIIVSPEGGT